MTTRLPCGSALKFCRVAEGAADIYPRLATTCEWDVAAGHALVEAAGGAVTGPQGAPVSYGNAADALPDRCLHRLGRPRAGASGACERGALNGRPKSAAPVSSPRRAAVIVLPEGIFDSGTAIRGDRVRVGNNS